MKVRKGGVEVRQMAVADPILAAYPFILYAFSGRCNIGIPLACPQDAMPPKFS